MAPAIQLLHHHGNVENVDDDDDGNDDDDDDDDDDDADLNCGDPVPPQRCHAHNSQSSTCRWRALPPLSKS